MNTITINVSGKNIVTYRSTLEQLEYFQNIFKRWNKTDEIFIDYDPDLFIHLLNKLRDNNYTMPNNDNIESMRNYFGLSLSMEKVSSPRVLKKKFMDFSSRIELNPKIILDILLNNVNFFRFCVYDSNSSNKKILEVCCAEDLKFYFKIIHEGKDWFKYIMLRKKYLKLLRQQYGNIYIKLEYNTCGPSLHMIVLMKGFD
jgi:hypothetical protein